MNCHLYKMCRTRSKIAAVQIFVHLKRLTAALLYCLAYVHGLLTELIPQSSGSKVKEVVRFVDVMLLQLLSWLQVDSGLLVAVR